MPLKNNFELSKGVINFIYKVWHIQQKKKPRP